MTISGILYTLALAVRGLREQIGYWWDRVKLARAAVQCAWNGHDRYTDEEDSDPAAGKAFQEYDDRAQEMTGLAGIEYQLEACKRCGEVYVSDQNTVAVNPLRRFPAHGEYGGRFH